MKPALWIRPSTNQPEDEFSSKVSWVQIDLRDDAADADHRIEPAERLRVAMQ